MMVPSILVEVKDAGVALYCASSDLLMVSDVFKWRVDDHFNSPGIFILWAMINHQ